MKIEFFGQLLNFFQPEHGLAASPVDIAVDIRAI